MPTDADGERLAAYIRRVIAADKLERAELGREYSYASLPLCVIDAVYSISAGYKRTTEPTVLRFAQKQGWTPHRDRRGRGEHTIEKLLKILGDRDSSVLAGEQVFKNRQRTSTRNGILKAEAVRRFAQALRNAGINDFADAADEDKLRNAEQEILQIPGQKSGISFKYFSMLAGSEEHVKADRRVIAFVTEALGRTPTASECEALVKAACRKLRTRYPHLTPRRLDYLIWDYQRSR